MMNFFQVTPTELHLNGPNVGFSSVPLDASATITGVATFTAIGTASFPYNNVNGTFSYQWYFDGSEILDTSEDSSSNADINTNSGISTLTLSGISGNDDNKKIFSVVTYVPGPDEAIIDYPGEGIGKSTSPSANLKAPPSIVVSKQPTSVVIGGGNTASFEVVASIDPGNKNIDYQWNLEGTNLEDGTNSRVVQDSGAKFPSMQVTSDAGDSFNLDWNELTTFDGFLTGREYTLTATGGDLTTTLTVKGAGGGNSNQRNVSGGAGGLSTGTFTFVEDHEYKLRIGGAGANAGAGGFSGGGNGGGGHGAGGGGGGFTGLFSDSITIGNAIIIAGGGGGGANDPATGGAGGGLTGGNSSNGPGPRGGGGGTQSSGGSGGSGGGGALQGGPGAAGGGGGYYGGAGGNPFPGCCADGGGGGGSSYIGGQTGHPLTNAVTTTGGAGNAGEPGSFSITRVATNKTIITTISGANTPKLTIFTNDQDFGGSLKCIMSSSGIRNSPLDSQIVSYDVVKPRVILNCEAYDINNNIKTSKQNLNLLGSFAVTSSTFGSEYSIIQFTSLEKDTQVTLEMKASAGANRGGYIGGEGGVSTLNIKIKRNVEYTLIGVSNNSAVFLYEKSSLVAVVGRGGDAGTTGNGGAGGGINIGGKEGSGTGNGIGGDVPTLNLTGVFGSVINDYSTKPVLYNGDTIAEVPDAGRTVICTKGRYYLDQGINPCSDISTGEVQFRSIDGTLVEDSSSLYRGFKPGYTVTTTQGKTLNATGGNGGAGAQGGSGAQTSSGGGGGGSGWTNRITSIVNSQLGGNTTKLSSVIFSPAVDDSTYYVDAYGRILIMAWSPSTPTNALPLARQEPVSSSLRFMNKITGKVLPTDAQNCIDDARWRAILDNARDGTQDWRLTATGWNNPQYLVNASPFNLKMMIDANVWPLESNDRQPASLTSWFQRSAGSSGYALAWDENDGAFGLGDATGGDYSLLWYLQGSDSIAQTSGNYGFGYYNHSRKPFFDTTKIYIKSANWWILPPGVPDFSTASPIFSPDQGNRDAPDNGINLPGA